MKPKVKQHQQVEQGQQQIQQQQNLSQQRSQRQKLINLQQPRHQQTTSLQQPVSLQQPQHQQSIILQQPIRQKQTHQQAFVISSEHAAKHCQLLGFSHIGNSVYSPKPTGNTDEQQLEEFDQYLSSLKPVTQQISSQTAPKLLRSTPVKLPPNKFTNVIDVRKVLVKKNASPVGSNIFHQTSKVATRPRIVSMLPNSSPFPTGDIRRDLPTSSVASSTAKCSIEIVTFHDSKVEQREPTFSSVHCNSSSHLVSSSNKYVYDTAVPGPSRLAEETSQQLPSLAASASSSSSYESDDSDGNQSRKTFPTKRQSGFSRLPRQLQRARNADKYIKAKDANNIASRKCREKKKHKVQELVDEVEQLDVTNLDLKDQLRQIQRQRDILREYFKRNH